MALSMLLLLLLLCCMTLLDKAGVTGQLFCFDLTSSQACQLLLSRYAFIMTEQLTSILQLGLSQSAMHAAVLAVTICSATQSSRHTRRPTEQVVSNDTPKHV
jgi:hypothetical protein